MKKIFTKEEKETINSDIAAIHEDMESAIEIVYEFKKGKVIHHLFDEDAKADEPENEEELERFIDKLEGIEGMISEIKEMILLPKVQYQIYHRATKKASKKSSADHLKFIEEMHDAVGKILNGEYPDGMEPPPQKVNKIPDGWYHHKEGNCNFLDRYNDDVLNLQFICIDDKFEAKKMFQGKLQKVTENFSQEQLKEFWIQNLKDSKPFPNN